MFREIHFRNSWILKVGLTQKGRNQTYLHSDNWQLLFENCSSTEDLSFSWVNSNCISRYLKNWWEFSGIAQSGIRKIITNITGSRSPSENAKNHSTADWLKLQKGVLWQNSCHQTSTCRCGTVSNKLETLELNFDKNEN